MRTAAERRAARLRTCRHFTGIQHKLCEQGVAYESVRDDSVRPYRWPCLDACAKSCAKLSPRTEAEIDAEDKEFAAAFERTVVARAVILKSKLQAGAIDCPCCKARGALRFRVASCNGHVHAACDTKGCVSWME